jgi:hypothetical protein
MESIAAKIIEDKAFGPLVAFLHEALTAVDPQYFEHIVVRFLATGQHTEDVNRAYRGNATLLNDRGQRRVSLEEFDYQFILQLFEFLTRYDVKSPHRIDWAPRFTDIFSFTRHVQLRVRTLKNQRNFYAHVSEIGPSDSHTKILVSDMMAVFEHEIAVVIRDRPDIFSQKIKDHVDAYVQFLHTDGYKKVTDALRSTAHGASTPPVVTQPESTPAVPQHETAAKTSTRTANRRLIIGMIAALLVALVGWSMMRAPAAQQIQKHYVLAVGMPLPEHDVGRLVSYLTKSADDGGAVSLTLVARSGLPFHGTLHRDNVGTSIKEISSYLASVSTVQEPSQYIQLIERGIDHASGQTSKLAKTVGDTTSVTLGYIGRQLSAATWEDYGSSSTGTLEFREGASAELSSINKEVLFIQDRTFNANDSVLIRLLLSKRPNIHPTFIHLQ